MNKHKSKTSDQEVLCWKKGITAHVPCGRGFRHKIFVHNNGQISLCAHDRKSQEAEQVLSAMGCEDSCFNILKEWQKKQPDIRRLPEKLVPYRFNTANATGRKLAQQYLKNQKYKLNHGAVNPNVYTNVDKAGEAIYDKLKILGIHSDLWVAPSKSAANITGLKKLGGTSQELFPLCLILDYRGMSPETYIECSKIGYLYLRKLRNICFDCMIEQVIAAWLLNNMLRSMTRLQQSMNDKCYLISIEMIKEFRRFGMTYQGLVTNGELGQVRVHINVPCDSYRILRWVCQKMAATMQSVQSLYPDMCVPPEQARMGRTSDGYSNWARDQEASQNG